MIITTHSHTKPSKKVATHKCEKCQFPLRLAFTLFNKYMVTQTVQVFTIMACSSQHLQNIPIKLLIACSLWMLPVLHDVIFIQCDIRETKYSE